MENENVAKIYQVIKSTQIGHINIIYHYCIKFKYIYVRKGGGLNIGGIIGGVISGMLLLFLVCILVYYIFTRMRKKDKSVDG